MDTIDLDSVVFDVVDREPTLQRRVLALRGFPGDLKDVWQPDALLRLFYENGYCGKRKNHHAVIETMADAMMVALTFAPRVGAIGFCWENSACGGKPYTLLDAAYLSLQIFSQDKRFRAKLLMMIKALEIAGFRRAHQCTFAEIYEYTFDLLKSYRHLINEWEYDYEAMKRERGMLNLEIALTVKARQERKRLEVESHRRIQTKQREFQHLLDQVCADKEELQRQVQELLCQAEFHRGCREMKATTKVVESMPIAVPLGVHFPDQMSAEGNRNFVDEETTLSAELENLKRQLRLKEIREQIEVAKKKLAM